jgi:hypothetical protein
MKIGTKQLKEGIIAEARIKAEKRKIYENILEIDKKIAQLNESSFIAGFGFQGSGDVSNKTKTGFVDNNFQGLGISNIARLAQEMGEETPEKEGLDEVAKLKEEIERLKEENKKLRK